MTSVFFEITDLVAHIRANQSVSGIQRFQLRVLGECAQSPHAERMYCLVQGGRKTEALVYSLRGLLTGDARMDLARIYALPDTFYPPRRWPRRSAVKQYLNGRGLTGWRRAQAKVGYYLRSLANRHPMPASVGGSTLPRALGSSRVEQLGTDANLVVLGAAWMDERLTQSMLRHAKSGGRVSLFVHDVLPLECPEYFEDEMHARFSSYFRAVTGAVSLFVSNSRSTRDALKRLLGSTGVSAESVVIPLAHEFPGFPRNPRSIPVPPGQVRGIVGCGRPFVLCVGTIEVRKNGERLLEAWLQLHSQLGDSTPVLVFCGRRGWKVDGFFQRLAAQPKLQELVRVVQSASDTELACLYQNCLFTVYPSLREGWGLPIGEAAWFGRVCITSSQSSMPEVLGELAGYVDPNDAGEIASQIHRAITDTAWRQSLESKIQQAELRTWNMVARDLAELVTQDSPTRSTSPAHSPAARLQSDGSLEPEYPASSTRNTMARGID